jgi:uncharacterized membrane protein YjdF
VGSALVPHAPVGSAAERDRRTPTRVGIASVALLAAFTAFSLARGDRRIVAYLLTWSLLAALTRAAHRRWPLPPATVGLLVAASGVHLAGGLLPSPDEGAPILYETWLVDGVLKFDQLAHAAMSGIVTLACFQLLGHLLDPTRAPAAVRAALAMLVAWGFGAANELFEFLSSLRFDDAYTGDLTNAGWDLAFNTAGSLTAAVLCALVSSERTPRASAPACGLGSDPAGGFFRVPGS